MLITQTPLRISLAGGGTDLRAYYATGTGAVLSSAIDKYIYVILNQRFDDKIYISYSRKEIVDSVDEIRHELVREAMRATGVDKGIELAIMADIPSAGSGLGSSSSLTVGLLNALYAYRGVQVTAERLAREACAIEVDVCGRPCGKQDQYIAAFGGVCFMEFHADESVTVEPIPLGRRRLELGASLQLFYTNVTREASPILAEQGRNTAQKAAALDGIRDLAYRAREAVVAGEFDRIGEILRENWRLKRDLAGGISTPALERMVQLAVQGGATGCKVSGAGGGGFLLTYCARAGKTNLRRAMKEYREMPFFLERFGSKVIFNVESYEWK